MQVLRFGQFSLDPARRILLRGDEPLSLRPQSFDVLRCLAERQGQLVSKDDLIAEVWKAHPASDDSLVQCIGDIRNLLGKEVVKTVPRRGYILVNEAGAAPETSVTLSRTSGQAPGAPSPISAALRSHPRAAAVVAVILTAAVVIMGYAAWPHIGAQTRTGQPETGGPSVTIVPFQTDRETPDQRQIAEALFQDLSTELSRAPGVFMISVKAIAKRLAPKSTIDARYVVLGNLRSDGGGPYVNIRLVQQASNRQLWAERYQYLASEQAQLAIRIARSLIVEIVAAESRRPLPANPNASTLAIRARALLDNGRGASVNQQARALFQQALAIDAQSIPALIGFARTTVDDVLNGWAPESERTQRLDQAEAALERAVSLNPRLPGLYVHRASILRARDQLDASVAALEHALAMNPAFAPAHGELGRAKMELGRADETFAHIEQAIRLSPQDPILYIWYYWAGQAAIHLRKYDLGAHWLLKARQANTAFINPEPWLALAYAGLGREDEARATIAGYLQLNPRLTIAYWNYIFPHRTGMLAPQRAAIVEELRRLGVPESR